MAPSPCWCCLPWSRWWDGSSGARGATGPVPAVSELLRTRPVDLPDDRTSPDAPATGGEPGRVVVSRLTRQYGDLAAVSDLSFTVEPGRGPRFLGPPIGGRRSSSVRRSGAPR